MALTKIQLKPGINREITRYSGEGGWFACDKVRFRQGFPEKIGGWQEVSGNTFLGVCRSLLEWITLGNVPLTGLGTHLKYYLKRGTLYYDITPLRSTTIAGDVTFTATEGSPLLVVNDTGHGAEVGDFVTFSGAVSLGGVVTADVLNREYQIIGAMDQDAFVIQLPVVPDASDTGDGGAAVVAEYQVSVGPEFQQALIGWGAGAWGDGAWGQTAGAEPLRLWNSSPYGEDLIYGPRGGGIYYWDATSDVTTRGVLVTGNDTPTVQTGLMVSDLSRFVIAFGCNDFGSSTLDPLLIRWSDQEQYNNWTPAITNQAGSQRLSNGSAIVAYKQNRQEVLVWTDTALYSMQYQGPPYVWGFQLMGDSVSVASPNAAVVTSGIAYWMGTDKFYRYDGRVQTLRCDLLRHVFNNINYTQLDQVTGGTNEQFNEIWWFYPSASSVAIDSYVVYNYQDDIWYYGSINRTAWLDSALLGRPLAASDGRLIEHEVGTDSVVAGATTPIEAFISSSEVDIGDGDKYMFIRRMLPDMTFAGSTAPNPSVTITVAPLKNSGSGFTVPASVGGNAGGVVQRGLQTVLVEEFTEQVNIRTRGRQIAFDVRSTGLGVVWQLGSPRFDMQPDGYNG